jgi:hypothetical protein
MLRRKICIHYNGDCCYKALFISVINCPGMFVYALVNSAFDFSMRYCFEDDKNCKFLEGFWKIVFFFMKGDTIGSQANIFIHLKMRIKFP